MTAEFDEYASSYARLLRDPLRDRFAVDAVFFDRRNWDVIQAFLRQKQFSTRTNELVGCRLRPRSVAQISGEVL